MAKATKGSQASNAANIINTGVTSARNLAPGEQAISDTAGGRAAGDYGNINSTLANSQGLLGQAAGTASSATPTLTDLSTTGGFSPADKTNYLDRATSGVKNTFSALQDNANRLQARTGASSGPAAIAQIARQGGQAQATAEENANADLNQQINANKLAGSTGLLNTGSTLGSIAGQNTGVANSLGNLYQTNVNQQDTGQQQLLGSTGLQLQGGSAASSNAGNFGNNPISNVLGPVTFGNKLFGASVG